jgi:hypothetical protein
VRTCSSASPNDWMASASERSSISSREYLLDTQRDQHHAS